MGSKNELQTPSPRDHVIVHEELGFKYQFGMLVGFYTDYVGSQIVLGTTVEGDQGAVLITFDRVNAN